MSIDPIPDGVRELADARQAAREGRDWPTADRLKGEIEAAGWTVTDQAHSYRLSPAHPPDLVDEGRLRHGSSRSVPSRLDEPPTGIATIVLVATDRPDDLERSLASLMATAPADLQVVIVANDPSAEQATALRDIESRRDAERTAGTAGDSPALEVVWTSARLGRAAALNAGLRRAAAPVAIVLDEGIEALGDVVTPLLRVLADPAVAVAGAWGLTSADLRRFEPAPAGDVAAIRGWLQAFRRGDFAALGQLDEHFVVPDHLDEWWSLVLRDGSDESEEPPRRAVALDLPVIRHEPPATAADSAAVDEARARPARRNVYRIIDRFNGRLDLVTPGQGRP
jgi:hypothetical protein